MRALLTTAAVFLAFIHSGRGFWECTSNEDCLGLEDGACLNKECACGAGKTINSDGTRCLPAATYYGKSCEESIQCSGLSIGYACNEVTKVCECREGYRYLKGRCWPSKDFEEECTRSEECWDLWIPFSKSCVDGKCACADGYYRRQSGECRKIAKEIGESCVLDTDCKIQNSPDAVCVLKTLTCQNPTSWDEETEMDFQMEEEKATILNATDVLEGDPCTSDEECQDLKNSYCSPQKHCICDSGYYPSGDRKSCYAEIGSPATEDNCKARMAKLVNGICDCPNGFFVQPGNAECKKPTRRFGESCADDGSCYTFGTWSYCAETTDGFKNCACNTTNSVQDFDKQICKKIEKVIGDTCDSADECPDLSECDKGVCVCSDGFIVGSGGKYCLKSDLVLGEVCSVVEQCRAKNSMCENGVCECKDKFVAVDDSTCVPGLGSECSSNEDCFVNNSECKAEEDEKTCTCKEGFVGDSNGKCSTILQHVGDVCESNEQCWVLLGGQNATECQDGVCACMEGYHERQNSCWRKTALGEQCSTSPQCFLETDSLRTECRNGFCTCKRGWTPSYSPDKCNAAYSPRGGLFIFFVLVVTKLFYSI